MINVTIKLHENYVYTCVRVFKDPLTSYTYEIADYDLPKTLLELTTLPESATAERAKLAYEQANGLAYLTTKMLDGLKGYFYVKYTLEDVLTDPITVEEARVIEESKGGHDVTKAFRTQLKMQLLKQIVICIAARDVDSLNNLLKTLIKYAEA